jgi:penicillin-binding protein 1A
MKNKSTQSSSQIILLLLVAGGVITGIIIGSVFTLLDDLPQIRDLQNFRPHGVTRIYSADGYLLSEIFKENRNPVPIEEIPAYLKQAILTTEDRKFYSHNGVDLKGIMRALLRDIQARKFVEGASTITQQLAKTLFLTPQKTLLRKIREAFLALQLERRYTKDEILELYLNMVYFGSGAYGVASAAQVFFGKTLPELDLAECALIAAMPKAPSRFSPLVNPLLAERRRNIVLKQMLSEELIEPSLYRQALARPLILNPDRLKLLEAPYFVELIKKQSIEILGVNRIYKGGLNIYTTLSWSLQKAAEKAVTDGLDHIARRMHAKNLPASDLQAALTCVDNQTGGILAMIGGKDFSSSAFNRAVDAHRQPGSAFKPLIYALAIENGLEQNHMLLDAPIVFSSAEGKSDWKPENFSHTYQGEMTLRYALAQSKNIPTIRLLQTLGPTSMVDFGYTMGIKTNLAPNLSLALGSSETRLIDLVAAYAVFPNQGHYTEPFGIVEINDQNGRLIWRQRKQKRVVLAPSTAAIMTDMLQAVVKEGTGTRARALGKPVAGKTGTTNEFRDALFIGFSPDLTAGVWIGSDSYKTLGTGETGSRAALPIWIDFMASAMKNQAPQYFHLPDDIIKISMDAKSGTLRPQHTANAVSAMFRRP